ncbi:arginase family protein [Candidatus Woesearchaeota archaeon]|nr:arginase family protein [Candidatus Woesearchaeota archaeon]
MKIIKCPAINGLGKTKGCELAPDAIIKILKQNYQLSESGRLLQYTVEQIPTDNSNPEQSNKNIHEFLLDNNEIPVILGGDHSITYPAFRAFAKKFQNPGLVVFDAHPDLVNNFEPPTHEDYLRTLIDKDILNKNNLVLVGLRTWDPKEYEYLKSNKIKHFTMREIAAEGLHETADAVMSIAHNFGAAYISIDIDAVDPAFAPATGYPEPAGITSRELLYFLNRLKNLRNLRAFDIVEINPSKDTSEMTVKLAAKIVSELL